jgi:phage/plasmid primase-like uncharacterized protein
MSLGSVRGGGVVLGEFDDALCVAEGVETALSAGAMLGLPAVAALGASNMATLTVPAHVRRVVIAPDRDAAGEGAAIDLGRRMYADGRNVELARPPEAFGDWNDWAQTLAAGGAHV